MSQVGEAQPYESVFGEESTSWNVLDISWVFGSTDSIFTIKDTVISGENYKEVRARGAYSDSVYFFREDTLQGKLYVRQNGDTAENLVMNLSLTLGDSFFVDTDENASAPGSWLVDSIYNDSLGKHIELIHQHEQSVTISRLSFIEGVGSSAGILYPHSHSLSIPTLLCAWKDGNQIFADSNFNGECRVNWSSTEDKLGNESKITLYPNPVREEAYIEFSQDFDLSQNIEMRMFDVTGQLVNMQKLNAAKTRIPRNNLPSGLYLIHVSNSHEVIKTFKVVFQ